MNNSTHKQIAGALLSPSCLKFQTYGESHLMCNAKRVQVVSSRKIEPEDYPPTDLAIYGLGSFSFEMTGADICIFCFENFVEQKTDYAIIKQDDLLSKLNLTHHEKDKINLQLILSPKGLHECYNAGAEAFFMALWIDKSRNFTEHYNNWSLFNT